MDSSNPAPLIVIDAQDIIRGWSEGAELLLGWQEVDVINQPLADFWSHATGQFSTKGAAPFPIEITRVALPGEYVALALRRADRQVLREQLDLTLSHTEIIGSWDWDISTDRVTADLRFAETFGVDPELARSGAPFDSFVKAIHPDDFERVSAEIDHTLKTGDAFRSEYRLLHADGSIRDVTARGRLIPGSGNRPTRFPGVVFDVTGRRSAERTAMMMRERYRSLFEMIEAGFCVVRMIWDVDGTPIDYEFVEVNTAFIAQTGITDAVGRRMRDIAPNHEQHWFDLYGQVARTQEPIQFENAAEALGRYYEVHAFPIDSAASGHVAILFMDKSEQRKTEMALRKSEADFRSLSQAMPNLVWTTDETGAPTWFNDRVREYSGLDDDILRRDGIRHIVHPDDLPAALEVWNASRASGTLLQTEYRMLRVDGQWRWHLVRGVPIKDEEGKVLRWIGTNTDIEHAKRNEVALANLNATLEDRIAERSSELMRTQRALQQAQKMETIGQLTGGIAHDFNNLLQVIAGNLQLLAKDVATNERAERRVANALSGVSRGAKLAAQLLAFGRRQALEPRVLNLGKFLGSMDDLLRRSIGEAVEVEVITSGGLWNTHIDPTQFENAALNLAINARDAMNGSGKLTIEVGNAFLDRDYADKHDEVEPGQYVVFAVSDTGAGMTAEIMEKVFEPFFSTKPEGQGTGLGLSMVYGFVKQSGGHIKIYSEVDQGTTIKVYLPRSMAEEDREVPVYDGPVKGGSETVLVVEDDDEVRATVVDILKDLGYKVLVARDAQAGLTVVESGIPIDVLFTDVVMPGTLKSREMARQAKERLPELVVLFTSGYTENSIVHGGKLDAGVELLSKPYTREALARRIRHLIANRYQVAQARVKAPAAASHSPIATSISTNQIYRILLVEDEPLIRMSTADMLIELGHSVIEAGNAAEALDLIGQSEVDVLITDVGLPDLSGGELALRARQQLPALPIVFATGESEVPIAIDNAWLLSKPYNEDSLGAALKQLTPQA